MASLSGFFRTFAAYSVKMVILSKIWVVGGWKIVRTFAAVFKT